MSDTASDTVSNTASNTVPAPTPAATAAPSSAPGPATFPTGAETLAIGLVAIATPVWLMVSLFLLPVLQKWAKDRGMMLPGPLQLHVEITATFGISLWLLPAVPLVAGVIARAHRLRERLVVSVSLLLLGALVLGMSLVGLALVALQFG